MKPKERETASKAVEILIVEDSATQAERLDYILASNGYATLRARDGREALVVLEGSRPALVVSDILMPNMDGFTLCRLLREDKRYRRMPVILVTALSDPEDVLKGLESGANSFIIKPYDEQYLLARVRRVLAEPPYLEERSDTAETGFPFRGREYRIAVGRRQILDLLISTYETAVSNNRELQGAREQLERLNQELERKVEERTALLAAEIEERKQAEEQVKRLNEQLEERIRQRTAQLEKANRELQQEIAGRARVQQDREQLIVELDRSNRELEQFAYVASHDLQAPLRTISGFLNLLARRYKGRLGSDADEFISYAVEGAERMDHLINDILNFSRIGTRGNPFEPLDSREPLEKALINLQAEIEASGAEITIAELPRVTGDRHQLPQLFQNLLGNALKYRKTSEPPRLHISARERAEGWEFRVADNGIGIEPRFAERIFQIFQRLHTSRDYPGTGIGLAVCKKIVERHGGRIWVESEPGQGSTFYFILPKP
jgi:signal transduction histidine kinase